MDEFPRRLQANSKKSSDFLRSHAVRLGADVRKVSNLLMVLWLEPCVRLRFNMRLRARSQSWRKVQGSYLGVQGQEMKRDYEDLAQCCSVDLSSIITARRVQERASALSPNQVRWLVIKGCGGLSNFLA